VTEQITEAQKLIASMRDVLSDLMGRPDANILMIRMPEVVPPLFDSNRQLHRLIISWKVTDSCTVTDDQKNLLILDPIHSQLAAMMGAGEMAKRRSDYKEALVVDVAKLVSRIQANLDKLAQVLKEIAPK
jgi:hypothetical protein